MRADIFNEASDGLTQSNLFKAIYLHIRAEIDSSITWPELRSEIARVKSHLKFPLVVYRGLSIELPEHEEDYRHDVDGFWDAQDELGHCSQNLAVALTSKIDFTRLGTSWTWDRSCAVEGGKLQNAGYGSADIILEATVTSKQCDILVTLWQNLTIFQEEMEVRLLPHVPITVTGITPGNHMIKLPKRGNTGPESWDQRNKILQDLKSIIQNSGTSSA